MTSPEQKPDDPLTGPSAHEPVLPVYRSPLHEVLSMALPPLVGMMSVSVMQFADFWMVARIGKEETAAVSPAGILVFVFISFFGGALSCTNTFVSQDFARRKFADCARYTWQGIYIALVAGLASLLLWPLAPAIFAGMGHEAALQPLEVSYFRWRLLSIGSMAVMMTLSGFFQGVSRPRITMVTSVAANGLNIFLNWVLIHGHLGLPRLEITGAAIATSIAAGLQAAALVTIFLTGRFARTFETRRQWRWDLRRARKLLHIGWPAGLQWMLDVLSWGVFTGWLVGRLGADPLAASNIAAQIMHLSFFPTVGLGVATTALVGQYIGRGDPETAHARAMTTLKLGMAYMGLMGVLFFVFRRELIALFTAENDPTIIAIGANTLILAAFFQAFDAMCIIYSSALKGAGDTRFPAVVSIAYNWLIFLPSSLLMGWVLGWGAVGAWGGATLFICALGLTLRWRWNRGTWKKIDIFRVKRFDPSVLVEHPMPHEPGEDIGGS